jgi:hypothetical protein
MERQPFIKKDLVKVTNIASLIDTPFAELHISLKGQAEYIAAQPQPTSVAPRLHIYVYTHKHIYR